MSLICISVIYLSYMNTCYWRLMFETIAGLVKPSQRKNSIREYLNEVASEIHQGRAAHYVKALQIYTSFLGVSGTCPVDSIRKSALGRLQKHIF